MKAFADRNGIPVPQPRNRDTLLKTVRENYQSAADKLSEQASYPGDWLYDSWSESDLKAWLDERGYPVPQPTSRDKLIASVRRNARLASQSAADASSSLSASAASATDYLSDALLDSWSDSQIKEWADKNDIKVPQGSKRNELLALARKHRAKLTGDNVADSVSSGVGAATTKAGNEYAKATDDASLKGNNLLAQFQDYVDWAKIQLGLETGPSASIKSANWEASASASSAASAASSGASSASKSAASAASSLKEEL